MSALIFDLDGTLIDASRDIHACAVEVMTIEGLTPVTLDQVRGFIGGGVPKLLVRCLAAATAGDEADVDQEDARLVRMIDHFQRLYPDAVSRTTTYPHVPQVLESLKSEGYRLAICTNKPRAPTHTVLRHLGLEALFDAFAYGDGDYPRKPDPAAVRHVIDQIPARRFLYVGDSEVDAQTAQAARLPMALFTKGFRKTPADQLYHDALFDDYTDFPAIAARLAPRPE